MKTSIKFVVVTFIAMLAIGCSSEEARKASAELESKEKAEWLAARLPFKSEAGIFTFTEKQTEVIAGSGLVQVLIITNNTTGESWIVYDRDDVAVQKQ